MINVFRVKNKKYFLTAAFLLVGVFLVQVRGADADVFGWFGEIAKSSFFTIIASLLYIPVYFLGKIVTVILIPILVWVAGYNDFISQEAVTTGWAITRDLGNLFIVAGILLIAIATLLNIETYSYKKLLPKLILAAVIINFSKMIMGFLIDVSQVITLTFVNNFKNIAAGNILNAVGIEQIMSISFEDIRTMGSDASVLALFGSLFLGVIVLVVMAAVLLSLVAYFVGRIIILWIAIILSPLLFALPVIPTGDKFVSQIWSMITKQLFSGPAVAFFLWLSFKIMSVVNQPSQSIFQGNSKIANADQFNVFISTFGNVNSILNFIVVVGLLMASLMLASQMGAAGSKFAGNLAGGLQKAGTSIAKWTAMRPVKMADWADRKMWNAKGYSPFRTGKYLIQGLKDYSKAKREREENQGITKAGENLKAGGFRSVFLGAGAGRDWAEAYASGGFLNRKGFTRAARVLTGGRFLTGGREAYDHIQEEIEADKLKIKELEIEKMKGNAIQAFNNKYTQQLNDSTKELEQHQEDIRKIQAQIDGLKAKKIKAEREKRWDDAYDFEKQIKELKKDKDDKEKTISEVDGQRMKARTMLNKTEPERRALALQEYADEENRLRTEAGRARRGDWSEEEIKGFQAEFEGKRKEIEEINRKLSSFSIPDGEKAVLRKQLQELTNEGVRINEKITAGPDEKERKRRQESEDTKKKATALEREADLYRKWASNTSHGTTRDEAEIENDIVTQTKRVKEKEEEQAKYATPSTFYSDQVRRSMIAEEMKKITSENADEQIEACKEAIRDKDWAKFLANFHAATRNGNDNEIFNELGYLNAYRGKEEDIAPGKGGGVDAFRKHYLEGIFKMGEQASMAEMDDIGYEAESIGHWSVARGYGIKGGRRYQKTYEDQQNEVFAEQSKMDSRKLNRQLNRLSSGGENYLANGQKEFILEPYELKRIAGSLKTLVKEIRGGEFNASKAQKWSQEKALGQIKQLKAFLPRSDHRDLDTLVDELVAFGGHGRQTVGKYTVDDIARAVNIKPS